MGQFPANVGISEIRGIIEIVKDNGGSLSLSRLAEESEGEIDKLLPLIDAAEMLGLCTVENGVITITQVGRSLTMHNSSKIIGNALKEIEPFKTVLERLAQGEATTHDLAELLKGKGITLHGDEITNESMLSNMLLKWGVRTKLIIYDNEKWQLYK
jgi:hypothetical protein